MSRQHFSAHVLAMFCFTGILVLGAAAFAEINRQLVLRFDTDRLASL